MSANQYVKGRIETVSSSGFSNFTDEDMAPTVLNEPPTLRQDLLVFLNNWRNRLVNRPMNHRSDEEFGQLLTLNTILAWLEDHR